MTELTLGVIFRPERTNVHHGCFLSPHPSSEPRTVHGMLFRYATCKMSLWVYRYFI